MVLQQRAHIFKTEVDISTINQNHTEKYSAKYRNIQTDKQHNSMSYLVQFN